MLAGLNNAKCEYYLENRKVLLCEEDSIREKLKSFSYIRTYSSIQRITEINNNNGK